MCHGNEVKWKILAYRGYCSLAVAALGGCAAQARAAQLPKGGVSPRVLMLLPRRGQTSVPCLRRDVTAPGLCGTAWVSRGRRTGCCWGSLSNLRFAAGIEAGARLLCTPCAEPFLSGLNNLPVLGASKELKHHFPLAVGDTR